MKCRKCNAELAAGTRFCPQCGVEVDEEMRLEEMKKDEKEAKLLAEQAEQELKEWREKKADCLKRENKMYLKWDNLKKVENGEYPQIKKHTEYEDILELLKEKTRFPWGIQVVIAILGIISIFMKWFNINMIGNALDLGSSTGSLFRNLIFLNNAVTKMNELGGRYRLYAMEYMMPVWIMIFLCIGILIMAVLYFGFLQAFFTKNEELSLRKWIFISTFYGTVISGVVLLLERYVGGEYIFGNNDLGMPYLFSNSGAKFAFFVSIVGLIMFVIQVWGTRGIIKTSSDEEMIECEDSFPNKSVCLEIVNYNPTLLFRPVRIFLTEEECLKIEMEFWDFDYPEINSVTAKLHLYKKDGSKIILPQITFERTTEEGRMFGKIENCRLKSGELREARIFIQEYNSRGGRQKGNKWYIDCDIDAPVLYMMRKCNNYPLFVDGGIYGEEIICNCGQMYHKSLSNCPLCAKENVGEENLKEYERNENLMEEIPKTDEEKAEDRRAFGKAIVVFLGSMVGVFILVLIINLVITITNPIRERRNFEKACEKIVGKWEAGYEDDLEFPTTLEISEDNKGRYNGFPMTYDMDTEILEITMNGTGNVYVYYYEFLDDYECLYLQYPLDDGSLSYNVAYRQVD